MNYWVGVIVGCTLGIILSVICFLCVVKQNENLTAQVIELRKEVADHERIMRQYEWFNWNATLKMDISDLEDK